MCEHCCAHRERLSEIREGHIEEQIEAFPECTNSHPRENEEDQTSAASRQDTPATVDQTV